MKSVQRRRFDNDSSDSFNLFNKIEQTTGNVPNDARNLVYLHSVDPEFGISRNLESRARPMYRKVDES